MTDAEMCLWYRLRSHQVNGHKFRRQHRIGPFVVDFVCLEKRLIIEVDGSQHIDNAEDVKRTCWLEREGYSVIRFWNNDVLQHTDNVVERIADILDETPPP